MGLGLAWSEAGTRKETIPSKRQNNWIVPLNWLAMQTTLASCFAAEWKRRVDGSWFAANQRTEHNAIQESLTNGF